MEKLLTTKDLAAAVGASESSMRRWTDSGVIRTSRTVGGHRRIPLSEALRFIRDNRATVVRPELLGLGHIPSAALPNSEAGDELLFSALKHGDFVRARGLVLGQYLAGTALAAIFDGLLAPAMHRIGEMWKHDPTGILIEHRASDICVQIVSEIRRLLPAADEGAPVAVGGAPAGDPYLLASMMAAAVLADTGYREVNFGPNTPIELVADAAEREGARLVWLSVSLSTTSPDARARVNELASRLRHREAHLVLGGRHADDLAPLPAPNVHVLHTMAELAAFTRGARPPVPGASTTS